MALYLNNLNLNKNQLQKAVVHPLGAAPTHPAVGQIYYDTGNASIYVCTEAATNGGGTNGVWLSLGGDMTGVTLTGGNGITATNTNSSAGEFSSTITLDISDSTLTTATSIAQDDLLAFSDESETNDPTKNITFSNLEDQIFSNINSASSDIAIAAGGAITVNTLNQNTTGSAGSVANALTVDNATVQLDTGTTYNGSAALTLSAKTAAIADGGTALATADQIHTFVTTQTDNIAASTTGNAATVTTNANLTGHITSVGNTASLGSFTTAQLNAAISDGSINSQTLPTDFVSAANGGTFSGNVSFGDNNISNVGDIAVDTISADNTANGGTITIGNQNNKSIVLGKTHSSGTNGTSVSVEQDLNVKGKLVVQGDIETSSTTNTEIKDAIIQITGAAANTANTSDIGFVFERGSSGNVAFAWDEGENPGAFKLIATGDTASSADIEMTQQGGENNDENTAGGTAPKGYQTLYAGIIRSVGAAGTSGFYGDGANITSLNGSQITSGTVAAARVATLNQSTTGNAATATKISSITNSNIVQLTETQTLTNKSIDADNNTLSNIEVDNFKASAIVTESEAIGSNDNDTTIPTSAAVKDYVDNATSSSGNTGGRQAFSLANAGSVAATNSGKTFTITHGMGASLNYGVEVIRAANGSGETVYTDVTRTTTTIVIDFAVAPTSGDYTALVCKY